MGTHLSSQSCHVMSCDKCCSFGKEMINCLEEIREGIPEKKGFGQDVEGS